MIVLIGAIYIYLSIKHKTIKRTMRCFTKGLTMETKITTKFCLELIHFGTISTVISFDGEYYNYIWG